MKFKKLKLPLFFLVSVISIFALKNQVIAASLTWPLPPADPSSLEAFNLIKKTYQIDDLLNNYKISKIESEINENFVIQTVHIQTSFTPEVVLVLKIPNAPQIQKQSAVVLFSGFQTGADAIKLVEENNSSIFVGFQYPFPIDFKNASLNFNWDKLKVIPAMMAVALSWLHQQPFIDSQKINVVTVSFGSLFYPLAQRFLNEYNYYPKTTVIGYGGVDITGIILNHLKIKQGSFDEQVAKPLIHSQLWFLEPSYHIHHLRGPTLVVHAEEEKIFPIKSRNELNENLQEPKKIIILPGPHIQPDRPDLIKKFMSEVLSFISSNYGI